MLEKNNRICILHESAVSLKNVYNCFFLSESRIIYVTDQIERFVGIITGQTFLQSLGGASLKALVNKQCLTITLNNEQAMLEEAERLIEKYHITTAIPVLDKEDRVCYEIREKREEHKFEILAGFYDKLRQYEQSSYVGQELVSLRKILNSQHITVIGTKEQFDCICGELFRRTNDQHIAFIRELENPYEFMRDHQDLLIDVSVTEQSMRKDLYSLTNNGYGWHTFFDVIIQMIERECFSRVDRVTDNPIATVKDYFEKYSDGRVYIASRGILTSAIKKCLSDSHLRLIEQNGILRENSFQYYYTSNGVKTRELIGGEQHAIEPADIMLQYFYLSKALSEKISVLNFSFDIEVEVPDGEKGGIIQDHLFCIKDYIANIKNQDIRTSLYTKKTKQLEYLRDLESSLTFCMTRRFENDLFVWKEQKSRLVNIENGIRRTCGQPEEYAGTIFFFGMCTIYGMFVEDSYTVPSIIQKYINESGKAYRVVNMGSALPENYFVLKEQLHVTENDIVVILFPFVTDRMKKYIPIMEIGEHFNKLWKEDFKDKTCFMDTVQHCGDYGNLIYAQIIYEELKKHLVNTTEKILSKNSIYNIFKPNKRDLGTLYSFDTCIAEWLEEKKNVPVNAEKIGCIVMNCNPFTLGHRYLIEYALTMIDYLYVFVVEENSSFFPFKDRYEMVKRGINGIDDLSVIKSGKVIISSSTFPAYFRKSSIEAREKVYLNEDLRIFAQYIAPVLDIQYRFVGEEPTDYVTNQYNIAMKRILPDIAGIQVVEIPRMEIGGKVVSATTVRECYKKKDFSEMSALVPQTTLEYLKEMAAV